MAAGIDSDGGHSGRRDSCTRVISNISAAGYNAHPLHRNASDWSETNCYVDFWIEVVHSLGFDPVAMLSFSFLSDFEGDQWLFIKPGHADLFSLYGIDVQEINVWDDLIGHVQNQVSLSRLPILEVDAYYLPDTQGISYRRQHAKTTICINEINISSEVLAYFHNSGYYELGKDDFSRLLQFNVSTDGVHLPPYAEFAKLSNKAPMPSDELYAVSLQAAVRNLSRRPVENPFLAYGRKFDKDMATLIERDVDYYHRYTFANLRQVGAAYQLCAEFSRWIDCAAPGAAGAAEYFEAISNQAKILLFKTARAVNARKPAKYEESLDAMAQNWTLGFDALAAALAIG